MYYEGCRAWSNSDDGWDHFISTSGGDGLITYKKCWAFENGKNVLTSGNGMGFKTGKTTIVPLYNPARILTNCLAFNNKSSGFDESQDVGAVSVGHAIYNCVAYNNGNAAFDFSTSAGSNGIVPDVFKNNIAYKNSVISWGFGNSIIENNSWQGITVTDSDFKSLDASGVKGARQADGSLPDLDFLKLSDGSKLIDKGVDVGLPYNGTAPDIGAYEYSDVNPTAGKLLMSNGQIIK